MRNYKGRTERAKVFFTILCYNVCVFFHCFFHNLLIKSLFSRSFEKFASFHSSVTNFALFFTFFDEIAFVFTFFWQNSQISLNFFTKLAFFHNSLTKFVFLHDSLTKFAFSTVLLEISYYFCGDFNEIHVFLWSINDCVFSWPFSQHFGFFCNLLTKLVSFLHVFWLKFAIITIIWQNSFVLFVICWRICIFFVILTRNLCFLSDPFLKLVFSHYILTIFVFFLRSL